MTGIDFASDCIMHGLRSAARVVTRAYEARLRPLGLTGGQFSTLAALHQGGARGQEWTMSRLARTLAMDRTTLTRNMRPLVLRGLVAEEAVPGDARLRRIVLTEAGTALFEKAVPLWQEAQAEAARRLGTFEWAGIRASLRALE